MNKSLLLIICDFLLISVLAMVEFVPQDTVSVAPELIKEESKEGMVELLKMSLDHESEERKSLEENLSKTKENLKLTQAEKDALAKRKLELENQTENLSVNLNQTKEQLTEFEMNNRTLNEALNEKESKRIQLQNELKAKLTELENREKELATTKENLKELGVKTNQLETNLQIKEAEKKILIQNLTSAQAEIERSRVETERAQAQAENLAVGVNELAASSTDIRNKIAKSETLSMNTIFRRFEENRIFLTFNWTQKRLFGSSDETVTIQSIPVKTDRGVFAIFSATTTPIASEILPNVLSLNASAKIKTTTYTVAEVSYFSPDKSIVAIRIPDSVLENNDIVPFNLTKDPLRFEDAVLIHNSRGYYGEIPVRAPPGEPNRLSVESRLFNRLFGEFNPSIGDYVISKQSELMGIMTEPTKARLIKEPAFNEHLSIGKEFKPVKQ